MKLVLLERDRQVAGNFSQSIYKRKDQVNVDESLVNDLQSAFRSFSKLLSHDEYHRQVHSGVES